MEIRETIAAIATPPGTGAIGVIRMSGATAGAVFHACTGRELKPRRATLVQVKDAAGLVLDDVAQSATRARTALIAKLQKPSIQIAGLRKTSLQMLE